ncbi:class I SAM-dependent methyltransferase [Paenibacillus sp. RC67]|uniref:class I SAM-dependent methyltransferase n=1 Tax=Paenibacillus sp. RC67 TaxID=3039392 RepID=UPI0024AE0B16|nr:class I SAM-dependent methyltransferase [Paenibacillus sp. RC67]
MDNHQIKKIWNEWSETWYRRYRTDEAISTIINNPATAFHHSTFSMIKKALPDLHGKKICVPSSGDNHAVFAFCLMGAKVTSCDISERQLENSSDLARKHGWDIEFICDDTMTLSKINSGEYDLVYTSNGVHIWIHDLNAMYNSIHRILKNDGAYILYEVHPFNRPFGKATDKINVIKPYDAIGPFVSEEVPRYTWRIQDIMNAVISSGLSVKHMEEMYAENGSFWIDESIEGNMLSKQELDNLCDWKLNPMAALPQWLSIYAHK